MNYFKQAMYSPWKAVNELRMLFLKPLTFIYLKAAGVDIGKRFKFYGFPRILKHTQSSIVIGDGFEDRCWWDSNPIGVNHPTIICTWDKEAVIKVGNDVGVSGGAIVAAERIEIGSGTLIGSNTTIIDTDFHPLASAKRRYDLKDVRSKPVKIGSNVFIGTNCLILKGSVIPDNSVVPAGSVVRSNSKFSG